MENTDPGLVTRHLEQVSGALGKSEALRKLLQYLVERSLRHDPPKELDIAVDVYGRDASFSAAQDAVVRVNVRLLRQKLDEYYRGPGARDELRFDIPKGGYRVHFRESVAPASADAIQSTAPDPTAPSQGRARLWIAGLVAVLLLSLIGNAILFARRSQPREGVQGITDGFVWSALEGRERTLTIVLGDLLLYGRKDPATGRIDFVANRSIHTLAQLRALAAAHPDMVLAENRTTMVPKSVVYGLAHVLPVVATRPDVEVRILDELQLEDIRNNDIIYIGPMVRLGPLADYFFARSRYRYEGEHWRMTDSISQKVYSFEDGGERLTDHGLFATFEGPSGNRIMLFTSVARDVGLLQIIRTMTSASGLEAVRRRLAGPGEPLPGSFEVLMTVTGYGRTDTNAELVDVHAMRAPDETR